MKRAPRAPQPVCSFFDSPAKVFARKGLSMMQQNHTNGRLTDRERTPVRLIVLRVLFTLFAAGTVVFIFSNSMQSGAASGLRSAAVTEWLNGGLARVGVGWRFSERLVRKLGHFSEYALLGFWLMLSLRVYTRRILSYISWPLFFGLLAGVLDEGIQMFADGRGSDVRDVVIDFSGVVFGLLAALFLLLLVRMFHVLRESKTPL